METQAELYLSQDYDKGCGLLFSEHLGHIIAECDSALLWIKSTRVVVLKLFCTWTHL